MYTSLTTDMLHVKYLLYNTSCYISTTINHAHYLQAFSTCYHRTEPSICVTYTYKLHTADDTASICTYLLLFLQHYSFIALENQISDVISLWLVMMLYQPPTHIYYICQGNKLDRYYIILLLLKASTRIDQCIFMFMAETPIIVGKSVHACSHSWLTSQNSWWLTF